MADPYEAVLAEMVEIEMGLKGIKAAYVAIPEAMAAMPCFINYVSKGRDYREEATTIRSISTFGAELHMPRGTLGIVEPQARPFIARFSDALWNDPTIGGSVTTVLDLRWWVLPIRYSNEWHFGVRFEIDAKMRRAVAI